MASYEPAPLAEFLQRIVDEGILPGRDPREPRQRRTLIGYWHFRDDPYSHPQALVAPRWEVARRGAIVSYLRSAPVVGLFLGSSYCRFGCPGGNGGAEQCDDRWCWPEGLAHYVEHHLIRLPDEFVAHAAAKDFRPPSPADLGLTDAPERDLSFWGRWCQQHAPFQYEACCHTCNPPPVRSEWQPWQPFADTGWRRWVPRF